MCKYDDITLEHTPPVLAPGEREHVLVCQDESIFHVNDQHWAMWLADGQAVLRQKGMGQAIMTSDFVCEKTATSHIALSGEEFKEHEQLPSSHWLRVTDAWRIIYPGKGHDSWWDGKQLSNQKEDMLDIFKHLLLGCIAVVVFDCSSAHEAFAADALNVNKMNFGPGGKQAKLCDTIIPGDNPPPLPGRPEYRNCQQSMNFEAGHPQAGEPKGMRQVLMEQEGVWVRLIEESGGKLPLNCCNNCKLSQKKWDALAKIAAIERAGQDEILTDEILTEADIMAVEMDWCCVKWVLSLQSDFRNEKPDLQWQIEARGHKCVFLPKFHCELNPIEMYWGFAKHSKSVLLLL